MQNPKCARFIVPHCRCRFYVIVLVSVRNDAATLESIYIFVYIICICIWHGMAKAMYSSSCLNRIIYIIYIKYNLHRHLSSHIHLIYCCVCVFVWVRCAFTLFSAICTSAKSWFIHSFGYVITRSECCIR